MVKQVRSWQVPSTVRPSGAGNAEGPRARGHGNRRQLHPLAEGARLSHSSHWDVVMDQRHPMGGFVIP